MRVITLIFLTLMILVPKNTSAQESVTLQLKWKHQFQFAGYYAAKELGFYKEEGLDVTLREATAHLDPARELLDGRAQYAVHNSEMILHYLHGEPVVALASIFQHSPSVLMVRSDFGITTPSDLVGRTIMLYPSQDAEIRAMLQNSGLSETDYQRVPHSWTMDELVSGKVAAASGYSTNEPFLLRKKGVAISLLRPISHGVDFYGDGLFTTRKEMTQHSGRTQRFLKASLKGWVYAMSHPGEIIDLILKKYAPDENREELFHEAEIMRSLVLPHLVQMGSMNPERWKHITKTYVSLGMAEPGKSLDDFIPMQKQFTAKDVERVWLVATLFFALLGAGALALAVRNRRLAQRINESRSTMETILKASPFGLSLCRNDSVVWANRTAEILLGYDEGEIQGLPLNAFFPSKKEYNEFLQALAEAPKNDGNSSLDVVMQRKDKAVFIAQLNISLMDPADPGKGFIASLSDITRRKQDEQKNKLAAQVFAQSQESVIITEPNGAIVDCNQSFTSITGFTREEALGKTPAELKSGKHDKIFYKEMWQSISKKGHWQGEIWNRRKDGELFPAWLRISAVRDSHGTIINYVGTFSDLTSQKENEENIYHLNNYDLLTGLPNRALFQNLVTQEVSRMAKTGAMVAVFVLDLDNFKNVNESLGIASGDQLLQETGKRLSKSNGTTFTSARLGSDEFALMISDFSDTREVAPVIEAVQTLISRPYTLDKGEAALTCTLGISVFPEDATNAQDLLKNAENALHHALTKGPGSYAFFSAEMTERASERLQVGTALRKAVEQNEFVLYYQPKIDLESGKIIGAEALIRWNHPTWGLVQPDRFIPTVEGSDLVHSVGQWVMQEACEATKRIHDNGFANFCMAINVSARQFLEKSVPEVTARTLQATGLDARFLELELTEALLVQDIDRVTRELEKLKEIGVSLAVDDFGTGYSSLSYLTSFPLDILKIDRSFVSDMKDNTGHAAITTTVIAMAKALGLCVVAEGVETDEQRDMLKNQGCHMAQGYYYSRPIPEDEFLKLLKEWESDVR